MHSKLNNYKIEISYDGSLFHGFQKQSDLKTVQSAIEESIDLILENYELNYAGRTDAGVHAKSQILSLRTSDTLNKDFLKRNLLIIDFCFGTTLEKRDFLLKQKA